MIMRWSFLTEIYICSVAWLMLVTSLLKLVGIFVASGAFLGASDPLLPFLNNGMVMAAAAWVEMVCFILIRYAFAESVIRQLLVILWCALLFVVYRLGLIAIDYHGSCKCLGGWVGVLGLNDSWVNTASVIVLAYFLIPSAIFLFFTKELLPSIKQTTSSSVGSGLPIVAMLTVGLWAAPAKAAASATTLSIEGLYLYENYILPKHNRIEYGSHGSFRIWIKWPQWSIFYDSQSAPTNKYAFFRKEYATCNEKGVIIVKEKNPGSHLKSAEHNIKEAAIYPGVVPPPFEVNIYNIWITMIAQRLWTNAFGLGYAPKISDASMFYNTNALCEYQYMENKGEDWLRKLVFREKGIIFGRDVHKKAALSHITLPAPYTNGYELAAVTWYEETNISGIIIPTSADIRFFAPVANATSANQLATCYLAKVKVNSITTDEPKEGPRILENGEVAYVIDYRFQSKGVAALTYMTTNAFPEANEKRLELLARAFPKQTLETRVLTQLGFAPVSPWKNVRINAARVLLVAVIAFPMFVLARAWAKKRKTKGQI
ncbi:MAG: hypothetical protein N3J91_11895 [Verrucomicrobiae bacterium]|uniref:hypothetical protein n=1 Tax=Fontisphaera persica TaxID=2974023 RepID=UPI0024C0C19A|nr:hypothetical protein [Fontisphaera persica]MCX8157126.1 hypothetical protein [Verrucomicrobiae bacterium]WCJ60619.1 hypothetical protein NXS98_05675 [Fontisphaera persica]